MKKLLSFLVVMVLVVNISSAGYLLFFSSETEGNIFGASEGLSVTGQFEDFEINLSSGVLFDYQNFSLAEVGVPFNATLEYVINRTLNDPLCGNYESDCSVILTNDGVEIADGESLWITSSNRVFTSEVECAANSCAQSIGVYFSIEQVN